ncbi:MAG: Gfo/Idh/MocA family oxidoreductase [Clostridia bacterium]|nr:Gfo/Idh/MocA family oxidoreductase [Clostridia bacterium]
MVKWGVLGTADIARKLVIPAMEAAGSCELYAVAGRSQKKADQFKEEFGFEKAYGSLEALLQDPEVQAVYIPLPNDMHKEWVIRAAEAGKDILCEKPLAPSYEDAKAMFEAADRCGVHLVEAFAYLNSPYMHALKQEVQSGVLGELLFIDAEFVTSDYNEKNIRMQKDRLGGGMLDLGCYVVSEVLYLTDADPADIHACGELNSEGVDVLAAALMRLGGHCRAACTVGMVLATDADNRIDRLEVRGTEGFIRSRTQFNEEGEVGFSVVSSGESRSVTLTAPSNYVLEMENVSRYFEKGGEPPVTRELSLRVARVLGEVLRQIGY